MEMQEIANNIVLTKPFSLRNDSDSEENYSAPNLLQRILSLLKNVRPGSDLTLFQASLISHISSFLFGLNFLHFLCFRMSKKRGNFTVFFGFRGEIGTKGNSI